MPYRALCATFVACGVLVCSPQSRAQTSATIPSGTTTVTTQVVLWLMIAAFVGSAVWAFRRIRHLRRVITESQSLLSRAVTAHANAETELAATQSFAQLGTFELTVGSDHGRWSYGLYQLLGLSPQTTDQMYTIFLNSVHADDRAEVQHAVLEVQRERKSSTHDFRVIRADGAVRWIRLRLQAIQSANDQPLQILGICHDTTATRTNTLLTSAFIDQHVLEKREATLRKNAINYSQNLNDCLTTISGQLQLTYERLTADFVDLTERDETTIQELNTIEASSINARRVCEQLLVEVTGSEQMLDPLNLCELALQVSEDIRMRLPHGAKVVVDWSPEPLMLLGNRSELTQMLVALYLNAAEAARTPNSTIHVRGKRYRMSVLDMKVPQASHEEFQLEDLVMLEVHDEGWGMSEKLRQQVVEPFFTTKLHNQGMGLSIVAEIARRQGGSIEIESQANSGTCVRIFLAVNPDESRLRQSQRLPESGQLPTELRRDNRPQWGPIVLVVDDNTMILQLAQTILESAGYHVLIATNRQQAVNLFLQNEVNVQLVVADVEMPLVNGLSLMEQLRIYVPDLRFVLMSGYSQYREQILETELTAFLPKPFRPLDLLKAVKPVHEPVLV
jgi:PAS domain S-box-containing protein